jgi:carnitine-CoA ligase
LSHAYFIKLGRFIADSLGYVKGDVVYAPMPMFHINPLGYGAVAALTACAGVLGTQRFKAEEFWDTVKQVEATAIVLHSTPTKMLLRNVSREDSNGHRVRVAYFAGPDFLEKFDVPIGVSGYGSTEAGGLCHLWLNRVGDDPLAEEGSLCYTGRARFDVDAKISPDGEILVRETAPNTLFSGYLRNGTIDRSIDEEGWFHTGDRGRFDGHGNLVFIERASESIRVNGEYVPIDYVERRLEVALPNTEFAIGAKSDPISGQRVVLFVAESEFDTKRLCAEIDALPKLMRPVQIKVIRALPRDTGVNKVQRRRLGDEPVLRSIDLTT